MDKKGKMMVLYVALYKCLRLAELRNVETAASLTRDLCSGGGMEKGEYEDICSVAAGCSGPPEVRLAGLATAQPWSMANKKKHSPD